MLKKEEIEKRIKELEVEAEKAGIARDNAARMRISILGGIIELKKLLEEAKDEVKKE